MRRLSQLSLVLGLLLWGPSAYAQSVRYQSQAISSRGAGIANATIAVCGQPANTNTQPCSPLATLATSTSTTSGGANPLTADSFGNFFFYAAPGRYIVQIYGPAVFGQLVIPDVEIASVAGGSTGAFSNLTVSGTDVLTNPGVFTNTQRNGYVDSLINGCNPATEVQETGASNVTEAVTGCVTIPASGVTVTETQALSAYVHNSGTFKSVGTYSLSKCVATGGQCWAFVGVSRSKAPGATSLQGFELDINPNNAADTGYGYYANMNPITNITLTAFGPAFLSQSNFPTVSMFTHSFESANGATTVGLWLGNTCLGGGTCSSQSIVFNGLNAGANTAANISSDNVGNLTLTPQSGQYVNINRNFLMTEGSAPGALGGNDICYGDSTAHSLKCSYNAGSFFNVPQSVQSGLVFDGVYGTYRVTADQTITAGAGLANIPGLSWTMPANTALNVAFSCKLLYNETTAATSMQFGIQDVTVAPTSLMAKAREQTNTTAFNAGNLPALTTTTATAIGAAFTPNAATTVWEADIDGMIEQPSNASTSAINIMAQFTTNNGVIKRGSYCRVW